MNAAGGGGIDPSPVDVEAGSELRSGTCLRGSKAESNPQQVRDDRSRQPLVHPPFPIVSFGFCVTGGHRPWPRPRQKSRPGCSSASCPQITSCSLSRPPFHHFLILILPLPPPLLRLPPDRDHHQHSIKGTCIMEPPPCRLSLELFKAAMSSLALPEEIHEKGSRQRVPIYVQCRKNTLDCGSAQC